MLICTVNELQQKQKNNLKQNKMKKLILLLLLPAFILSCSSDDDNITIEEENVDGIIRITQVNAEADLLVLSNLGTTTTEVGDYWLCLGPGTYVQVSNAATGSTNLAPNQSITLTYDVDVEADGLSLFSTNEFASSDPSILLDFMQWGAGNQARASQAVTAGRWDNASSFIPLGSPYNFNGEANEFGSSFYEISTAEANAVVRILQVDASADIVWLSNFGTESVDVADFFLCLGPVTYVRVADAANGSTTIAPGANIQLSYDVNETEDGLSIFSEGGNFGSSDPEILLDYVQWGAGNQARVDQAVTAGRWDDAANFVADGSPYAFTGEAADFGSTFWEGTEVEASAVLRILQVNPLTDQVWLTNLGNASIDVADHFLCLGPGTYVRVSDAASGSTVIEPGSNIMLDYDMNPDADGLSVFSVGGNFGSTDPSILLDYVQWGDANQMRVDQAITAGRWDSAENFVEGPAPYSFIGEADEFGSTFWDTAAESRTIRVLQFNAQTDQVWLSNFGNITVDVSDYFLCLGPGTYVRVSDAADGASTELAPGENVMLSYNVNESVDGLSVFSVGGNFGSTDPSILIDYVQWGGANQMRVSQAVTAGRWDSAANFVEGGPSYTFNGEENEFGSTFWD